MRLVFHTILWQHWCTYSFLVSEACVSHLHILAVRHFPGYYGLSVLHLCVRALKTLVTEAGVFLTFVWWHWGIFLVTTLVCFSSAPLCDGIKNVGYWGWCVSHLRMMASTRSTFCIAWEMAVKSLVVSATSLPARISSTSMAQQLRSSFSQAVNRDFLSEIITPFSLK